MKLPACMNAPCPLWRRVGHDVFHLLPNALSAATWLNKRAGRKDTRIVVWQGHYMLVPAKPVQHVAPSNSGFQKPRE